MQAEIEAVRSARGSQAGTGQGLPNSRRRVLVAITTGRPVFRRTLDLIARNAVEHGHADQHDLGVLVNHDSAFSGLADEAFSYPPGDTFNETLTLGAADAARGRASLIRHGLSRQAAELLLPEAGYGNKRNLILIEAVRRNYDTVLFWDDDEYPVACLREGSRLRWISTDVFGAHLSGGGPDTDVRSGFRTGHALPIVPDLQRQVSPATARALGEALAFGTEFIDPDFVLDPGSSLLIPEAVPAPAEIAAANGGKWVAAANLSIRVASVREGRIPAFYIPFGGRGEDTIFSMQLDQAKACRVPSGIFHDCFLDHTAILAGDLPTTFDRPVDPNRAAEYARRFANALRGWFSYSPLMLWLRDPSAYGETLGRVAKLLEVVDRRLPAEFPGLAEALGARLTAIFQTAAAAKDRDYAQLRLTNDAWTRLLPLLRDNAL